MRTRVGIRRWLYALAAAVLPVEAASAQPSCDGARSNLAFIQQRMAAIRADAATAWGRMTALRAEETRRQACDKCEDSLPGDLAKARAAAAEHYERARREAAGWTAVLPRAEQDVALHCTAAEAAPQPVLAPPRIDPPLAMPLPPKVTPALVPTITPTIAAPLAPPASQAAPSPPAIEPVASTASIPTGSGAAGAAAPGYGRVDAAQAIARGALALSRDATAPRITRPISARPGAPAPQGKEKPTLPQLLSGTTVRSTATPAKKIARKQNSKTTP